MVIESVKKNNSGFLSYSRWLSVSLALGLSFLFYLGVEEGIISLNGEVDDIMIVPVILTFTFMLGFLGTFSLFQMLLYGIIILIFVTGGMAEFGIEPAIWISILFISISILITIINFFLIVFYATAR